jgi:maltooligosyltrehalose trehalohydrolase
MATSTSLYLNPEDFILTDLGPCLHDHGVTYRVWALGHKKVRAHIETAAGLKREISLEQVKESGYFFGTDPHGAAGDLYRYSLDGGTPIPDFVSHYQPEGVLGPSMIVDARSFSWQAQDWQRPAWNGQVIYECHIGAFTKEGTYRAAIQKLDHLCDLGITALQIMPVADWMGQRNWGYDGVMLFAPSRAYGTPDDFRALIDACHLRGLAVILDIVFNHLGPEGNFSHEYSHIYFHEGKDNPWGKNFNLDGPNSLPVRRLLCQNIRYWLEEFRIDGFRMDATDAVHDTSKVHLLSEVADIVHDRGGFIIAEDHRNTREVLEPHDKGGWNFDAAWADDFHHIVRVNQTGEQYDFFKMYRGTLAELVIVLQSGWFYRGEISPVTRLPRGMPCEDFPPQCFVYCISNHDQVGNRVRGDRFHEGIDPAAYRALSLLICLVPYTPMFFMGQEWAASSPFPFFTDKSEEMGALILQGRRREFLAKGAVNDENELEQMMNPQLLETFTRAKLDWTEISSEKHRAILDLYRAGLKLRRELFGGRSPDRDAWSVELKSHGLVLHYRLKVRAVAVALHLEGADKPVVDESKILLRSSAPSFAGSTPGGKAETIVYLE